MKDQIELWNVALRLGEPAFQHFIFTVLSYTGFTVSADLPSVSGTFHLKDTQQILTHTFSFYFKSFNCLAENKVTLVWIRILKNDFENEIVFCSINTERSFFHRLFRYGYCWVH